MHGYPTLLPKMAEYIAFKGKVTSETPLLKMDPSMGPATETYSNHLLWLEEAAGDMVHYMLSIQWVAIFK